MIPNWNKTHNEQLADYMTSSQTKSVEWFVLYAMSMLPFVLKLYIVMTFVGGLLRPEIYTWRELLWNFFIYAVFWSAATDIPTVYTRLRFWLHYSNKLAAPWWKEKPASRIILSK
jgi:hypothetical protein